MKNHFMIWSIGAILYSLIEILWRGFTHWTMAVTGGFCFLSLYEIQKRAPRTTLRKRCLFGASVITCIEFAVGCIVNRLLHWNIWDYSERPMNLLGQICPLFFFLWFLLCVPGFFCCRLLNQRINKKISMKDGKIHGKTKKQESNAA